jgi:tetratricopeptide (TPR) repeat protein
MSGMVPYELKPLLSRNYDAALALAAHYRDLNQPEAAESICRDVLAASPTNEDAWRLLGLSLTDRFSTEWATLFDEAQAAFGKLSRDYDRMYFTGLAWERYARAKLDAALLDDAIAAYDEALRCFGQASELGPVEEPGPVLHYNRCVRALTSHPELVRRAAARQQQRLNLGG